VLGCRGGARSRAAGCVVARSLSLSRRVVVVVRRGGGGAGMLKLRKVTIER
jgi:hypothetical protein